MLKDLILLSNASLSVRRQNIIFELSTMVCDKTCHWPIVPFLIKQSSGVPILSDYIFKIQVRFLFFIG